MTHDDLIYESRSSISDFIHNHLISRHPYWMCIIDAIVDKHITKDEVLKLVNDVIETQLYNIEEGLDISYNLRRKEAKNHEEA